MAPFKQMGIAAMLPLAALLLADLPAPVFKLDGENGVQAEGAGKSIAPSFSKNIQATPGQKGQAIEFGENGELRFPAPAGFSEKSGSLSFWIRLDQDTLSRSQCVLDRDRLPGGGIGKIGDSRRQLFSASPETSIFYDEAGLQAFSSMANIHKRWFKGQWNFVALSWNAQSKRSHLMVNGLYDTATGSGPRPYAPGKLREEIVFGSSQPGGKGACAALDEICLYDKELSQEQMLSLYAATRPCEVELTDFAWIAGEENPVRLRFKNISSQPLSQRLVLTVVDAAGNEVKREAFDITAAPGEFVDAKFSIAPPAAGLYRTLFSNGKVYEAIAISPQKISSRMAVGDLKLKLLEEIDCAASSGEGRLRGNGRDFVVHDKLGAYRETANETRSGFVYRLGKIANPKRYHVLEIEYPDNAKRAFTVSPYSAGNGVIVSGQMNGIGIITGGLHQVTGRMQSKRLLWCPYSEDVVVLCENFRAYASTKGAALSRIRVYEVESELLPKQPALSGNRKIGVWDEDPTMDCAWFNMPFLLTDNGVDLEFWREKGERIAEYALHQGYNTWTLQLMDYWGDRNGSHLSLRPGRCPDSSGHIYGCNDAMIKVLEREGISFYGRLGVFWAEDSYRRIFIDERELSKDLVDFAKRGAAAPELVDKNGQIVTTRSGLVRLNPLHPLYRQGLARALAFYRDKYGNSPAFLGLTLRDTNVLHSLVGLDYGYDDYTVGLFEKETGAKVPSDASSIRFHTRYKFLTSPEMLEKWIAWRCSKFAEASRELTSELRRGNERLRLQSWVSCYESMDNGAKRGYSTDRALREAGIDMALLSKIEGLDMVPVIRPDYEQVQATPNPEAFIMYSQNFAGPFRQSSYRTLNIMFHNNLENYPGVANVLPELFFPTVDWELRKQPVNFLSWANCHPDSGESLLPLTNMLANLDLDEICLGWWGNPDCGVTDQYRLFIRAFRSIPNGRYALANKVQEPVAMRVAGRNSYLVNKESFPVKVAFRTSGTLQDLVSGQTITSEGGNFTFTIKGQELRVFACSEAFAPSQISQTVDPKDLEGLSSAVDRLSLKAQKEGGELLEISGQAEASLRERDYTETRRLLLLPKLVKALETLGSFELSGQLVPEGNEIKAVLRSYLPGEEDVEVSIESDGSFQVKDATPKVLERVRRGETRELHFPLQKQNWSDGDGGRFVLKASSAKGGEVKRTFLCGGPFAYRAAESMPSVGSDWSFKNYRMKEHLVARPGVGAFRYSTGGLWSDAGLWLAVDVEDKDYFVPGGKLLDIHADSLQVFLALNRRADFDAYGYDEGDMEFMVYEKAGRGFLKLCEMPRGLARENSRIRVAMIHEDGHTKYEAFIPKGELPGVALKAGSAIGASIMVNNRIRTGNGEEKLITSPEIFPYKRPGTWSDLIFVDEPALSEGK